MTTDQTLSAWRPFAPLQEYWIDAWQRSILCLDALGKRGDTFWERSADPIPHVLGFKAELVRDGRTLPDRPVNYLLVRIVPPDGVTIDPAKRPFVVVDPRAGHGPGIGGMKQDSEIGVALAAGHPCYFIGFLPEPVPGQTIEDVWRAEALFVQEVAALHAEAEGKPAIIANCQAGWQTMIMAAVNPDLAGPIMLAGSPLSYWAGVHGKNPMRYTGGVLGGTWLTSLAGDMGGGIFDGANLVANFESLNPANTYWEKPYGLYSKVDTEAPRFLEFETWWGSPVLLNAEEMQWIADNLFVGNKLTSGGLHTADGTLVDLRNVKSQIIVLCSWGDNITPPQQALDWITDIYKTDREIAANGQTIVYTLHETIGHLGIFVSGKVATKEHSEFTACMAMIDLMPPGLYEAVITEADPDAANSDLVEGQYLFTLEARTLDDIRALGGNSPEDDQRFATAARVSEVNKALYQTFVSPMVSASTLAPTAEAIRQMHPNRLRFGLFSDRNPMMHSVESLAKGVREARKPAAPDNPFVAWEAAASSWISTYLNAYGEVRDAMTEATFMRVYGSPALQAAVGLGDRDTTAGGRVEDDLARQAGLADARSKLDERFEAGDLLGAELRALIYVSNPEGSVDETGFAVLKQFREAQPAKKRRTMVELKDAMREQSLLMRLDEERAIQAIPKLLPAAADERQAALAEIHQVIEARGALPEESQRRLERIDTLFA